MGIFSYFRRRRERESAIPGLPDSLVVGEEEPVGEPVPPVAAPESGADQGAYGPIAATDLGGLIGMVTQAFRTGTIQVTQGESQVIDLSGSGLGDQIVSALRQRGIDPAEAGGTEIDAGDVPGLREEILQALRDAGVEPEPPGAGTDPEDPGSGDPDRPR